MSYDDISASLPPRQAKRIRKALASEPNDKVIWVGAPDARVAVKKALPIATSYLGLFIFISMYFLFRPRFMAGMTPLDIVASWFFAAVFLVPGVATFLLICTVSYLREKSKLFVLTDKRALVIYGSTVHEYKDLNEVLYCFDAKSGVTDFVFHEFLGPRQVTTRIGFTELNRPNGDKAKQLLQDVFNTRFK